MNKKSLPYLFIMLIAVVASVIILYATARDNTPSEEDSILDIAEAHIIRKSDYTYDGEKLGDVKNIVVHYVANPGSSAIANRNYFNSLADKKGIAASAHFIVGLDGEIIQCVPLDCVSWANGNLESNRHSITIECCHPDESGKFNEATLNSLRKLIKLLCDTYSLSEDDIIRHYDVTGKLCPKYFVDNEDEWVAFKNSILE